MKLQAVYFTFLLSMTTTSDLFNFDLIKSVQTFNNIKTMLILTCETTPKPSIAHTIENFQSDATWINILDISNGTNISVVNFESFFLRLSCSHIVVCNLMCHQSFRFLTEISKLKMFHGERNWLFFSDNLEYAERVLSNENINSDAEITLVVPDNQKTYHLYDVYNPSYKRHGKLNITEIGRWHYKVLEHYPSLSKFEERRNFRGVRFHAVITIPKRIINKTLYEHIQSVDNPQTDSIDRFNYHLFTLVRELYNFKLFVRRSKIWGVKMPNGLWLGSIGMVNRSEVDIMISGVRWDNERYGAFDQTTNTYFFKVVFIFRHPKEVDAYKAFISPFVPAVWFLVILLALIIAFGLHRAFTIEYDLDAMDNDRSYSNCVVIVFG